ncbi:hypothetical protein BV22DRAFT_297659 [Leucogyrophana mollusca]|uniref:Uncharacterized protein n=1 Tax=Leucogyrophana mollusca TaxID=85980 RepID=A0ACB8BMQ4_9AGAM|nr:hypothetical protein BV22DRAFT_297659 [Leucogyrophana mollusca]
MWTKLSHALKRSEDSGEPVSASASTDVLSRVYEQHPNLSVFHDEPTQQQQSSSSPPSSPSKRRGMLKRISKVDNADIAALRLIPKKVKSHLHLRSNPSQASLTRISTDTARPSLDSINTPVTTGSVRSILRDPKTPGTGQNVRFFSRDAYKAMTPDTSAASIEPDPLSFADRLNKAGIDQPHHSSRPSVMEVFSPPKEVFSLPKDKEVFSPPLKDDASSFMAPFPPPDMSNIFDMSQEHDLPTIPLGLKTPLLDSAIELDADTLPTSTPLKPHDRSISFSFGQTVFHSMSKPSPDTSADLDAAAPDPAPTTKNRNRALSDTVFQSMIKATKHPEAEINDLSSPSLAVYASPAPEPDPFRANATTYYTPQTMIPPTPPQGVTHSRTASREEDIIWSLRTQLALQQELNAQYEVDLSARDELVRALEERVGEAEREGEKRRGVLKGWKKKAGELERMCRRLEQTCGRLEEEVEESRMERGERSVMDEASGEALRQLHRQIGQLEREKAELEGKVEARIQEQLEERVKGAVEERVKGAVEERLRDADAQLEEMREVLRRRDESERALKAGIRDAKEQMEEMGAEGAQFELQTAQSELQTAQFDLQTTQSELELLRSELAAAHSELEATRVNAAHKDEEHTVLKSELEAQWVLTEKHGEERERLVAEVHDRAAEVEGLRAEADALQIQAETLKAEMHEHTEAHRAETEALKTELNERAVEADALKIEVEALKTEVHGLEAKIVGMEEEWNDNENRRAEVEAELQEAVDAREEADREREELADQLAEVQRHLCDEQEHAAHLTNALQEQESRLTSADSERQFALENVSRLEANVKTRDTEIDSLSARVRAREAEAETLREELSTLRREYTRLLGDHEREVQDLQTHSADTQAQLEVLLTEKAQSDVKQERVGALEGELERLRRQVHELQQASADKEVVIVQLKKRSARDKEDLSGLNIALDSKQQELELVKRRLGVRGTGGSTPAQPSKVAASRRDSSIFATPSGPPSSVGSRPPSVLSDAGSERKALGESASERKDSAPRASAAALGKSVRMNLSSSVVGTGPGKMGPPAAKFSRPSVGGVGTPTPASRVPPSLGARRASGAPGTPAGGSMSASTSGTTKTPGSTAAKTPMRRPSSSLSQSQTRTPMQGRRISVSSVPSELDEKEKENVGAAASATPRRVAVPA